MGRVGENWIESATNAVGSGAAARRYALAQVVRRVLRMGVESHDQLSARGTNPDVHGAGRGQCRVIEDSKVTNGDTMWNRVPIRTLELDLIRRRLEILLRARRDFESNVNRRLFLFSLLSLLIGSPTPVAAAPRGTR